MQAGLETLSLAEQDSDTAKSSAARASILQTVRETISKLEAEVAAARASAEQLSLAYSQHLVLTASPTSGTAPYNPRMRKYLCLLFGLRLGFPQIMCLASRAQVRCFYFECSRGASLSRTDRYSLLS